MQWADKVLSVQMNVEWEKKLVFHQSQQGEKKSLTVRWLKYIGCILCIYLEELYPAFPVKTTQSS